MASEQTFWGPCLILVIRKLFPADKNNGFQNYLQFNHLTWPLAQKSSIEGFKDFGQSELRKEEEQTESTWFKFSHPDNAGSMFLWNSEKRCIILHSVKTFIIIISACPPQNLKTYKALFQVSTIQITQMSQFPRHSV